MIRLKNRCLAYNVWRERALRGSGLQSAIIYSGRFPIREAVQSELLALDIKQSLTTVSEDSCIQFLKEHPESLLVLDFERGLQGVLQILEGIRCEHKFETRPIFLLAQDMSPEIVLLCKEYGLTKVHTGEVSRKVLKQSLQAILTEEEERRLQRKLFVEVAKLRDQGRLGDVIRLLEAARERDEHGDVVVASELAQAYIDQDRWAEALFLLEPYEAQNPPNLRALHLLGRCRLKFMDFSGAVYTLRRATLINPQSVERLVDLGEALLYLYDLDEAKESFDKALALDPNQKRALRGKQHCRLLQTEGDVDAAVGLLSSMSSPSELAAMLNVSGVIAVRNQQVDQGMKLYQSGISLLGEQPILRSRLVFNRGLAQWRQGELPKAFSDFEQALKMDPEFAKARTNAELLGKKLGNEVEDLAADLAQNEVMEDFEDEALSLE